MNAQNTRSSLPIVFPLWVGLFCFTIVMGLLFQKLILPSIPSLHAGFGLMNNDAIYFHQVAETIAIKIQANGWSLDTIWPNAQGAKGNVAVLAGLYALFGVDPSLILPVNAALHATSGILVMLIVQLLCPGRLGRVAGIVAAVLFVMLPSSLNWYAQVHKDGYAIAGTLLVLYAWLRFFNHHTSMWSITLFVGGSLAGILLILFVRPYNTVFLTVAIALWLIVAALFSLKKDSWGRKRSYFFVSVFVWLIFLMVAITFGHSAAQDSNAYSKWNGNSMISSGVSGVSGVSEVPELCTGWHWQQSSWLPVIVEKYAETAARTRAGLICGNFDAPSNVDRERLPNSAPAIIAYMPRVLAISLLGPFPDMWFNPPSMMRLVGALEMLIWYLLIPGVFLAIRYHRSKGLTLCLLFVLCYLAIYGFTIGNMGTLHRVRYPFLLFFMAVGVLGWLSFLNRKGILEKIINFLRPQSDLHLSNAFPEPNIKPNRKRAVGSGIYVAVLTLLSFIGFFYRDILMAHIFGLGAELDAFFVALLIPMTIVTILCIPLGVAFTPLFLSALETAKKKDVQVLISGLSAVALAVLSFICLAIYFTVPYLLPYVAVGNTLENMGQIRELTMFALPILLFSGSVILGNAVLNALGKVVTTGIAQLVVPGVAILAVVLYGERYGVYATMVGMVAGQLLNLLIIQVYIKKYGYSLVPKYAAQGRIPFAQLTSQYFPLISSAFFVSVAILVNTLLAMSLPEGGVSVFNLGNKVVLLATGLIGAAISTVMLPYFSILIAKNHVFAARRELSVFLLFLTFFSVPISVALFVWSEQIVELIFEGGNFGSSDVDLVARVMQYAVLQIPFFACNVLLLKFATATKHVMAILLVAILGLLINVGASLFFMKHMGVAGIALGASLSMVIATICLILILVRYRHVGLLDMIILLLNWLLFVTLLVCVHFGSIPGIVVTILAYLTLLAGYSKLLFSDSNSMVKVI